MAQCWRATSPAFGKLRRPREVRRHRWSVHPRASSVCPRWAAGTAWEVADRTGKESKGISVEKHAAGPESAVLRAYFPIAILARVHGAGKSYTIMLALGPRDRPSTPRDLSMGLIVLLTPRRDVDGLQSGLRAHTRQASRRYFFSPRTAL